MLTKNLFARGAAVLFALAACFAAADHAAAVLLAREGAPTTTDGSGTTYDNDTTIRGVNEPRLGFANAWESEGGFASSIDFFPRLTGLTSELPGPAGRIELARTGGSSTQVKVLKRDFDYTFSSSDDIWVSYLFNYHFEEPADPEPAFFNIIFDGAGDADFALEIDVDGDGTIIGGGALGTSASVGTFSESPTTTLDDSETHMVVIRAQDSTDGPTAQYDRISVWIDPEQLDRLGAPDAEVFGIFREQLGVDSVDAFDQLRLEGRTMPPGFRASFDELRLGTEARDVVLKQLVIPEPSGAVLLWGGLLMLRCARRKRK